MYRHIFDCFFSVNVLNSDISSESFSCGWVFNFLIHVFGNDAIMFYLMNLYRSVYLSSLIRHIHNSYDFITIFL